MPNNQFNLDMSKEEREQKLLSMSDEDIDYSDIPPLDDEFFKSAKLIKKQPSTEPISIRIDSVTLRWFRNYANSNPKVKGYQTLINDVLRTYVEHQIKDNQ